MNKKIPYLAVNLIAPGVGQLLAKKWILGSLMLCGSILCILWFTWEAVYPIYRNMMLILNGYDMDYNIFNVRNLILAPVFLILIWIISYVELMISKDDDAGSSKPDLK